MRAIFVPLGLMATVSLCGQETVGHWYVDVHSTTGTLTGHYLGIQDGQPFQVDLKNDLAIACDKTKTGFGLEYQGHRFGLEVSLDEQDYTGTNQISRQVKINGTTYDAGALVTSNVKSTTTVFNWTIRALTWEHVWLGVDLGIRGMTLDMSATGVNGLIGMNVPVEYKVSYPVPQVGLSAGFNAFSHRLVVRGFYHGLAYSGASFGVTGADVRFFPLSWVGVRGFYNSERLRVPKGSVGKDVDITLSETRSGGGIVFRF